MNKKNFHFAHCVNLIVSFLNIEITDQLILEKVKNGNICCQKNRLTHDVKYY